MRSAIPRAETTSSHGASSWVRPRMRSAIPRAVSMLSCAVLLTMPSGCELTIVMESLSCTRANTQLAGAGSSFSSRVLFVGKAAPCETVLSVLLDQPLAHGTVLELWASAVYLAAWCPGSESPVDVSRRFSVGYSAKLCVNEPHERRGNRRFIVGASIDVTAQYHAAIIDIESRVAVERSSIDVTCECAPGLLDRSAPESNWVGVEMHLARHFPERLASADDQAEDPDVALNFLHVELPCLALVLELSASGMRRIELQASGAAVACCSKCTQTSGCVCWAMANNNCSLLSSVSVESLQAWSSTAVLHEHHAELVGLMRGTAPWRSIRSRDDGADVSSIVATHARSVSGGMSATVVLYDECFVRRQRHDFFESLERGSVTTALDLLSSLVPFERHRDILHDVPRTSRTACRAANLALTAQYSAARLELAEMERPVGEADGHTEVSWSSGRYVPAAVREFSWKFLSIHTHDSINDLITVLSHSLGLNATVYHQNFQSRSCKRLEGACLAPMWPVSEPYLELSLCPTTTALSPTGSRNAFLRDAHVALSQDAAIVEANVFLCVHPPVYCELFLALNRQSTHMHARARAHTHHSLTHSHSLSLSLSLSLSRGVRTLNVL